MAKKKKKRGRPKGSGDGGSKKSKVRAPESLNEMFEASKYIVDGSRFVFQSISRNNKDNVDLKDKIKRLNIANQALNEIAKECKLGRLFFRDYLKELRELKKSGGKVKSKKPKKKKKKKNDDEDF